MRRILAVLLAASVSVSSAVAVLAADYELPDASVIMLEDFEDKTEDISIDGTLPQTGGGAWSCSAADTVCASVKTIAAVDGEQTKAMYFEGNGSALTVTHPLLPPAGNYTISMMLYDEFNEETVTRETDGGETTCGSLSNFLIRLADGDFFIGFDFSAIHSDVWQYRDGVKSNKVVMTSDGKTPVARSAGWHKLEIRVEDNIGTVYIDDMQTNVSFAVNMFLFEQLSGWYLSYAPKNAVYVDDITITGAPISFAIIGSDENDVTVRVTANTTGTAYTGSYTAIAAAYRNDALLDCRLLNKDEINGSAELHFSFADGSEGVRFKFMVWDSANAQKPLKSVGTAAIDNTGIAEFTVCGTAAAIDNESCTITADVSDILIPTAEYTLKNDNGTLDVGQGDEVKDGQTITYTSDDGKVIKKYTVSLNKIPFKGYTVPEGAELILAEDCSDGSVNASGWELGGAARTENAYSYNGAAAAASEKDMTAAFTFPEGYGANTLVTMKFYSKAVGHSFRTGFVYSDYDTEAESVSAAAGRTLFGGCQANTHSGDYTINSRDLKVFYKPENDSQIKQSAGWHELAAYINGNRTVTYYIDGEQVMNGADDCFTEKLPENVTMTGIMFNIPGWNSIVEGAVTDIRAYRVPEQHGISTMKVCDMPAEIDDESGTITAVVYDTLIPTASYTLKNENAVLDIEQGAELSDGQTITYTSDDGKVTKKYTVSLNKIPFKGYTVPEDAELVLAEDCSDESANASGWELGGAERTENAYSYNGAMVAASEKDTTAAFTFPEGYGANTLVTMKFYSKAVGHSFRTGFVYSDYDTEAESVSAAAGRTLFGGCQANTHSGDYTINSRDLKAFYKPENDSQLKQSAGWHELAAYIDGDSNVTYYIDGEQVRNGADDYFTEKLPENVTMTGIMFNIPGWNSIVEGAVTDIKVYSVN